ncbi:hypothetical protein [Actinoallomurus iriomotensis]|uniref:Uncharacterized protein n=1 Tax=Actinoallomurus iriomotensis TaxID=478107 RepID=A0A9W6VR62_9ACTN|nr:hypothetical protein [Actinoallomurus iriomotensis]GLY81878.1 hypothetical protein Airi01_101450 [Actinoallomurus iriomotensis]
MCAAEPREPARPRRTAQSAGSRQHLHTAAVFAVWFLFTLADALLAAAYATEGHDPTICLGLLGASWILVTPYVFRSMRRPRRKDTP